MKILNDKLKGNGFGDFFKRPLTPVIQRIIKYFMTLISCDFICIRCSTKSVSRLRKEEALCSINNIILLTSQRAFTDYAGEFQGVEFNLFTTFLLDGFRSRITRFIHLAERNETFHERNGTGISTRRVYSRERRKNQRSHPQAR